MERLERSPLGQKFSSLLQNTTYARTERSRPLVWRLEWHQESMPLVPGTLSFELLREGKPSVTRRWAQRRVHRGLVSIAFGPIERADVCTLLMRASNDDAPIVLFEHQRLSSTRTSIKWVSRLETHFAERPAPLVNEPSRETLRPLRPSTVPPRGAL